MKIISTRTLREEIYNISQLVRAMRLVADREPRATLTLAGDGPDRERFAGMVRELGLAENVNFTGWADPEALARQLGGHRVYVSTSRADGASVSLFEAMAIGVYPVVSDIAANREWICDGENGRLFPLDDPEALARTILEALNAAAEIQPAIETNRLTARTTFSWDGIAQRLENIYFKVIS
jgi:glycosyltransferase involved in cell wall biosynthesis